MTGVLQDRRIGAGGERATNGRPYGRERGVVRGNYLLPGGDESVKREMHRESIL